MTQRILSCLSALLAMLAWTASAATRTSANYSLGTETVDAGGRRSASANYANDGSLGSIGGTSTVAAPPETVKHSYIGQLYEVSSVLVAATPTTVNEGATRQLTARAAADDGSLVPLAGAEVDWGVVSGPITAINASGLATAGIVYQNEAATVRGRFQGASGTLGLTVVNINIDNFGLYAGDAVDDLWQVQNFGLNNPAGVGSADPDGDDQDNHFEYTAGTIPTDPASLFALRIERVVGFPGRKDLIFSPRFPSRTYTVQYRDNFSAGSFGDLGGTATTDVGPTRTVTDLNATGESKFYRVRISFP